MIHVFLFSSSLSCQSTKGKNKFKKTQVNLHVRSDVYSRVRVFVCAYVRIRTDKNISAFFINKRNLRFFESLH